MQNRGKRYKVDETKLKENKKKSAIFITIFVIIVAGITSTLLFISWRTTQTNETSDNDYIDYTITTTNPVTAPTEFHSTISSTNISESPTNMVVTSTQETTQASTVETTEESIEESTEEQETKTWLVDIDNPDYDYTPQAISLSDGEREEIARIVMGEFGDSDFTGCALLAQSIRDGMATYGFSGYSVQSGMQYYGYNSNPNQTCYEAVDWIFSGNAAVQHRILIMNNAYGGWHATQNLVVYYDGVWFYDLW